ncbi:MAG: phytanoyl-CoA dioxygenase family protein [Candidatus Hodarchaeales archaeon]|jgi:ectoine hydroxylase-related dioxygenase (phytanoyl-CoA dioxygenase family)
MYDSFYNLGFQIFENVLTEEEIKFYKERLSKVYDQQIDEFGLDNLSLINEENMVRSPFLYDSSFINIFYNDFVSNLVTSILGKFAILSLQNGIVLRSNTEHHQSFFHRDLIYQNFTTSKPISINIYYCLDDYDINNGGTTFMIGSHKKEYFINEGEQITPKIKSGSVILFDSMLFHKAGSNTSSRDRFGINNMFTLPFVKQQINYSNILKPTNDKKLNQFLGFKSREFFDVKDFRNYRLNRMLNEQ